MVHLPEKSLLLLPKEDWQMQQFRWSTSTDGKQYFASIPSLGRIHHPRLVLRRRFLGEGIEGHEVISRRFLLPGRKVRKASIDGQQMEGICTAVKHRATEFFNLFQYKILFP
jgi:hypothetical protein